MDTMTFVAILAGISAFIITFSRKERSILGFLLLYGISFAAIIIIFAATKFVTE